MAISEYLKGIPLFEGLPEDQLEDLSRITSYIRFGKGEIIFSEGDKGNGFYVLLEGRVKIYKLSPDGKEQTLHIFGPGEPFGEVPVFAGKRFPANAETMQKSTVLFFPRNHLVELIKANPSLAMNMLAVLAGRLRQFTVKIEHLSLKDVSGRVAAYILYLSEQSGDPDEIKLDITKGQMASLLGTIPETLSRVFNKMARQGLVEIEGPTIRILRRSELEELVEGYSRLE